MARARNIKPSIYKNELLGVADPLLTILFTGLWCLADREGRLEDRPLRIKAEIFPYRDLPLFNGYLTELAQMGFIHRYTVDGVAIIQVVNFCKHQSPHKTEKESELPEIPKDSDSCEITVKAPLNNEVIHVKESLIPDSLIPDSGYLKPDKTLMQKPAVPACPVEQIIQLYKDTARRLPSVRLVPDSTKAHIRARWLQDKRFQSLEFWQGFFEYCENNKFLSGQSETRGDRKPFRASLAWVVNASNFAKIINEDYA
jgi:hypothetical protein